MIARAAPLVLLASVAALPSARAQDLDLPALDARSVARAGGGALALDDGAALAANPAALARRDALRVQASLALVDRSSRHATDAPFAPAAPSVEGRVPPAPAALVSAQVGVTDRVVVGAALRRSTTGQLLPAPTTPLDPARDDRRLAPHRYAGTTLRTARTGLAVGAAVRLLPAVAVGGALLADRVTIEHERTLWGGPLTGASIAELDPGYDLAFRARGVDPFVVTGVLGVVGAPAETLELGASLAYHDAADVAGPVEVDDSRGSDGAGRRRVTVERAGAPRGALSLPPRLVARLAARWVLPRASLELQVEAHRGRGAPTWRIEGVELAASDGARMALERVPLGPAPRDAWVARLAFDVDVVPGLLSAGAGYAYASPAIRRGTATLVAPGGGRHVVAVGVEARAGGALVALAIARREQAAVRLDGGDAEVGVIAPFAGAAPPAATGQTDGAATIAALSVEVELP